MKLMKGLAACLGLVLAFSVTAGRSSASATVTIRTQAKFAPTAGHALSKEQQERLENSLRRLTGLTELCFTSDGWLSLGDQSSIQGGSATARYILFRALESNRLYIIEDHSQSPRVHFGQLDAGLIYSGDNRGQRPLTVWRVRLDFKDFEGMQAPPEVRASFDEGITLLHELLHGLGLKDTRDQGAVGQCEEMMNRVRAELGLPLRDSYLGEQKWLTSWVSTVRLKFKSRAKPASGLKWRSQYLFFLAERSAE